MVITYGIQMINEPKCYTTCSRMEIKVTDETNKNKTQQQLTQKVLSSPPDRENKNHDQCSVNPCM